MLATARRVVECDRFVRAGRWKGVTWSLMLGGDVHGRTLGIIGFGRIGKAIARRAQGFGMRVLYHTRRPDPAADGLGPPTGPRPICSARRTSSSCQSRSARRPADSSARRSSAS